MIHTILNSSPNSTPFCRAYSPNDLHPVEISIIMLPSMKSLGLDNNVEKNTPSHLAIYDSQYISPSILPISHDNDGNAWVETAARTYGREWVSGEGTGRGGSAPDRYSYLSPPGTDAQKSFSRLFTQASSEYTSSRKFEAM